MIKRLRKTETGISTLEENKFAVTVNLAHTGYGAKNEDARLFIQTALAHYLKRNKAEILEAYGSVGQHIVWDGLLQEEYYMGYVQINITKTIKNLGRVLAGIEKEVERIINDPAFNDLTEEEVVEFKPENTAIDTRFSTTADMIVKDEEVKTNTKVLDYGCGTGRNIKHILDRTGAFICGTDIPEQLEKEQKKHDKLRDRGCAIKPSNQLPDNFFEVALNSHVLNVIESDEIKQFVVDDIYKKLTSGGRAFIEVRTKSDVEGAKTKQPHGDGWKIKCKGGYTYQEAITKEKMVKLVTNAGFKIEKHIFSNSSKHIIVVAK